jgi:hypothetical protein
MPTQEIYEYRGNGTALEPVSLRQHQYPRLRITTSMDTNVVELPCFTIVIDGEPVGILNNPAGGAKDSSAERDARAEAKKFWRMLSKCISVRLGIEREKRGKPGNDMGKSAAFFHDHCGDSWAKVAQRLCPNKHQHNSRCRENFDPAASFAINSASWRTRMPGIAFR